ncbi:MAG: TIGR00266 family protein [Bdellovibrionaceae bacterium]|nr:TIGR00266 family protein [Pseudobdellovibrionaceae bacterium]
MDFKFEIIGKPDYSYLRVQIPSNKTLKVEASAMATMDTQIQMKTKMKGGFGRILSGENIFINEFTSVGSPGTIEIAPGPPGDISHVHLSLGEVFYVQSSSYVASSLSVNIESRWQGLARGFFSGAGLFLIRCTGPGDLWFNSFGGIFHIDVKGETVVDNGHIVAFTSGLDYDITKVGGYKSLFLSGEGLVCRFRGEGKVWVQNRKLSSFAAWIHPFRRIQRKDNSIST